MVPRWSPEVPDGPKKSPKAITSCGRPPNIVAGRGRQTACAGGVKREGLNYSGGDPHNTNSFVLEPRPWYSLTINCFRGCYVTGLCTCLHMRQVAFTAKMKTANLPISPKHASLDFSPSDAIGRYWGPGTTLAHWVRKYTPPFIL